MNRKFCYLCGGDVKTADNFVYACESCGQTFYENPKPCVEIALFNQTGQILLAKRMAEPFKGKYDLPGGFVDKNETLEGAMVREIKEELGIEEKELKDLHFVGSYNADYPWGNETFGIVIAEFTATIRNDLEVLAMDDVEEVKWIEVNELDDYDLSVPGLRPMIEQVLKKEGWVMLDDLKMIHERDGQDALGVAEKQWQQLKQDYNVRVESDRQILNVIIGGMGGSALAATLLNSWPKLSVPFQVVRNYDLPKYAGYNTVFIASSYSGNTEETLECLRQAEERGCQIFVIAAGGELEKIATEKNYPFFKIPEGFQPRMAVFYNFSALIQLLESLKLIDDGSRNYLKETADWLGQQINNWKVDVPTSQNLAKQTALELEGRSIVIYSGPLLAPAGYKWKINFNENSKTVAWCNQYPEFDHNELLGWTSHPTDKPYAVIDLRCNLDNDRIKKRFEISERLLSGKRPAPHIIDVNQDELLKALLWVIVLGDFVSLYLAFLNGLNPSPVEIIAKLKEALKE